MAVDPKMVTVDIDSVTDKPSIARILGLSVRRIEQLAQDGVFKAVSRGKYGLGDSIRRYIKYISKDAVDEDDVKTEKTKRVAEASMKQSKAKMAALQLQEMEGKMYRAEDIEAVINDLVYGMRGSLMALPGRLSVEVVGVQTAAEAAKIIQTEVHKVLRDLAQYQYSPKVFKDRINARNQMSAKEEEESDDA